MTRRERRQRDEARHDDAVAALQGAFDRPATDLQVAAFAAAARDRFEGRFRPATERSWRRPLLALAGAAVAAAAVALLVWPAPAGRLAIEPPQVAVAPAQRIVAAPPAAPAPAPAPALPAEESVITTDAIHPVAWDDPDTARVTVAPASEVRVARWNRDAAVLELATGRLRSKVRPRTENQRYEVRTPYAVVRVVGTDFEVEHVPGEATVVIGHEGRVTVETRDGRALGTVGAGETLRVEPPRVAAAPDRTAGLRPAPSGIRPAGLDGSGGPEVRGPAEARGPAAPPAPPAVDDVLAEARGLLSAQDDARALALLDEHAGRSWRVRALLGDALRVQGRDAEARAAYEQALAAAGDPPPAGLLVDLATLLGDDPAAPAVWERYLASHPGGRAAATAHDRLAATALRASDDETARRHLAALLTAHGDRPEATRALVRLGRLLLAAERWDDADALFSAHRDHPSPARAEAALVGLVRVRIGQGRVAAARRLVATYDERFPDGRRGAEMDRLRAALSAE